jgi:hypothetical protein
MLNRPEIGSWAHVSLWLADKDPEAEYKWEDSKECPCAQYAREQGLEKVPWTSPISTLASGFPRTWGALYERTLEASNGTASNTWSA